METFAEKIIDFNKRLDYSGELPNGISIINPFKQNEKVISIAVDFYRKYYNDNQPRHLILGINPGRFGAGVTGIPFTDTKRLVDKCDISYSGKETHEPSSVFVYEVIDAFGGVKNFYKYFYINSICPLGFTVKGENGKVVNYNYYDSKELTKSIFHFIVKSIEKQIAFGINTDVCFCFGNGKNENFLRQLNNEKKYFKEIIALEHPRYIMQYRSKNKQIYIDKYIKAFKQTIHER